ncbi:hypothetical protein EMGBD4_12260 [Verrucomicrobiota bacterium]|nr:hypothetical protein EMGBD4_12260 [Verrucomicrobiota bacterium]
MFPRSLALIPLLALTVCAHPVPDNPQWLTYAGGEGPGKGKHIVLIAADQEYRSEQSMPMLAKVLSTHHGFDCTVLFAVNDQGLADPTMPVYPEKGKEKEFKTHHITGWSTSPPPTRSSSSAGCRRYRCRARADREVRRLRQAVHRAAHANHGFHAALPYKIDGKQVELGRGHARRQLRGHHGRYHADSTRGIFVEAQKEHPILRGVTDVWGNSDVYRTYKKAEPAAGCTALVWGQPLMGRQHDDPPNPKLEPLPVAWFKTWHTSGGLDARVFQCTMGSGDDLPQRRPAPPGDSTPPIGAWGWSP